jgi:hypothetical protein
VSLIIFFFRINVFSIVVLLELLPFPKSAINVIKTAFSVQDQLQINALLVMVQKFFIRVNASKAALIKLTIILLQKIVEIVTTFAKIASVRVIKSV